MVKSILKKTLALSYVYLILLIMYLPILLIIAFAFSDSTVISMEFGNGTFDWFISLFSSVEGIKIWKAVGNTLIIAVTASITSVVLGS